jgi:uncharacterized protein (DUF2336 family)
LENQDTIQNLLSMAGRPLPEDPSELYQAIGQIFQDKDEHITPNETQALINILWHITTEIELSIRIKLADKLASRSDVPAELMFVLASDDIRVAYNVLVRGNALADTDLIKIVRHRTKRHQLAITARNSLSEAVTNALVETNDKDVIVSLLNNTNASISKNTLSYIVDESQRVDEFQRPLVRRDDLPKELVERMCAWISIELLDMVNEKHLIDGRSIRNELDSAAKEVHQNSVADENAEYELIKKMAETGGLNDEFLTDSLKQGHVTLFEHGIAELAGTDRENVLNYIYDYGEEGLAVLSRASNFNARNYLAVRRLVSQSQGNSVSETMADREILLGRMADLTTEQVKKIISVVNPNHSRKAFLQVFYEIFNA